MQQGALPKPHGLLLVLTTLPHSPFPPLSAANLKFLVGSTVAAAPHTQLGQGWDSHVFPTVQQGGQRGEGEQVKLWGETGIWGASLFLLPPLPGPEVRGQLSIEWRGWEKEGHESPGGRLEGGAWGPRGAQVRVGARGSWEHKAGAPGLPDQELDRWGEIEGRKEMLGGALGH